MALTAEALINEILKDGDNLQKAIVDRLSEVKMKMPGLVDKNGDPVDETKPFEPISDAQIMEINGSNKEKSGSSEKYTGMEAIVEVLVENIIRISADKIVDHILNKLVIEIPPQKVITAVAGNATGTLNPSPIKCTQK